MSVQAISTEIVSKYLNLHQIASIKPKDNKYIPLWDLKMGKWNVSQLCGMISCRKRLPKKTVVEPTWRITNSRKLRKDLKRTMFIDAEINTGKQDVNIKVKPFWMRKKKALERISAALTKFIDNYNDDAVVEKGEAPIKCWNTKFINWVKGENPDFKPTTFNN